MLSTTETIGICLFELPDKDQAVIQRVITFGASQGKHYSLQPEVSDAQIIITLDNTSFSPRHATIVRIGESDAMECDLLLQRPLLVTRVMRAIDDAAQMHRSKPAPASLENIKAAQAEAAISPPQSETQDNDNTEEGTHLPSPHIKETPIEAEALSKDEPTNQETESSDEVVTTEEAMDCAQETAQSPAEPEFAETTIQRAEVTTPAQTEEPQPLSTETVLQRGDADAIVENTDENLNYRHLALVVDDSAAIRKQLEIELRNAHIKADFAETGEEALEKSAQKEYELIFLDIIMPGIDGYEVCRQMRSRKSMKKTPIIMLSGKTSPLDEVQGVIAGASTYLTKPVKHEQFQQTLKRVSKWLTEFSR